MAKQRALRFPRDFLWGTASAAYQAEGGNTNNQWYRWEKQGHILSHEQCGDASDWWHRAESDFERAEQMENNALRLSVEWSRIEPTEGHWDTAVMERYRAMLLDLRRRRMTPLITLHHFTEPLWFADRGGFVHEANIRFFTRFVAYVVRSLSDLCSFWLTLNEPNVYAVQGYQAGVFPPGQKDFRLALQVLRNMMQAHVAAFYTIRELQASALIGYCLHYRLLDPSNRHSLLDRGVAGLQGTFFNWATLQAGETGHFPFPVNLFAPPIPRATGARDYHGINYYTREMVRFAPDQSADLFGKHFARADAIHNDPGLDSDFGEIYPEGIYRVLKTVYQRTRGNKPLYITENGFADSLDDRRPRAILQHLVMVQQAIGEGIPVRGYFHWTLVDNFEWNNGWHARFGLIEIDPVTQRRMPRRSASMFGEIARANAITEDIVARYAPDLLQFIFGGSTERELKV